MTYQQWAAENPWMTTTDEYAERAWNAAIAAERERCVLLVEQVCRGRVGRMADARPETVLHRIARHIRKGE